MTEANTDNRSYRVVKGSYEDDGLQIENIICDGCNLVRISHQ